MRLSHYHTDAKGSGKDPELTPEQEIGFILARPRIKRGTRSRDTAVKTTGPIEDKV